MSLLHGGFSASRRMGALALAATLVTCLASVSPLGARAQAKSDAYGVLPEVAGLESASGPALKIGHRTWHLQPVADMAMVRLAGGKSLAGVRSLSGTAASLADEVKAWPNNPAENIAAIQATGEAARGLASASGSLSRALAFDPGFAFVGPVYQVGGRLVGVADTLCVKFDDSIAPADQQALIDQYGLTVVKTAAENHGLWKLAVVSPSGEETISACQSLSQEPGVAWVSPNFFSYYEKFQNDPVDSRITDQYFKKQWHLHTPDPQVEPNRLPALPQADIDAPEAWQVTQGNPELIVGVIDDGVDSTHPDLDVLPGLDTEDGVGGGAPEAEDEAHGTAVAGVIAAKLNGEGVVGVAPQVKILPVRLGFGTWFSDDQIRLAFLFCVDRGAAIINNSWGIPWDNDPCTTADDEVFNLPIGPIVGDALNYAWEFGREGKGTVILFAAGNSRADVDNDELNANPLVVTVAASNNLARRSVYSNYGDSIDVCAPSSDSPNGNDCDSEIWLGGTLSITTTAPGGYDFEFGGTSSACPTVAGVAALVLSVNPNLRFGEVKTVLERSADKIDPLHGEYDGAGHSIYYGHGKVNAAAAVALAAAMGPSSRFFLEGWAGYSSVSGLAELDLLYTQKRMIADAGYLYGFPMATAGGNTIFVHPELLTIDDRGVISGVATIVGTDAGGAMVRKGEVPVKGRAKLSAKGTAYQKINVNNQFVLSGGGLIGAGSSGEAQTAAIVLPKPDFRPQGPTDIRARFRMAGKQIYPVYPGKPLELPGFATWGRAAVTNFGQGYFWGWVDGLIKNEASFTSTNLEPKNAVGTSWKGDAVLTTDLGRAEGGAMSVAVRSAVPEVRLGVLKASAKNGRTSARSVGTHDVVFESLEGIGPVEERYDPTSITFRSPAAAMSIRMKQ